LLFRVGFAGSIASPHPRQKLLPNGCWQQDRHGGKENGVPRGTAFFENAAKTELGCKITLMRVYATSSTQQPTHSHLIPIA